MGDSSVTAVPGKNHLIFAKNRGKSPEVFQTDISHNIELAICEKVIFVAGKFALARILVTAIIINLGFSFLKSLDPQTVSMVLSEIRVFNGFSETYMDSHRS